MPRVKRKNLKSTALTERHINELLVGNLGQFDSEVAAREAWEEHRAVLLDEWIADNPCTRPYSWWAFDAPERRRCLNGLHPHDCPAYKAQIERVGGPSSYGGAAFALSYGVPRLGHGCEQCAESPEFEIEAEYLARLGLLTEHELKLAETGDYELQEDAEGYVCVKPRDRYCGQRNREHWNIPKGRLLD